MSFSSSSVPLNTVLNSYFPSTTKAAETRLFTKLGNSCVDLNTLYTAFFLAPREEIIILCSKTKVAGSNIVFFHFQLNGWKFTN